jgi:hypothetical protein
MAAWDKTGVDGWRGWSKSAAVIVDVLLLASDSYRTATCAEVFCFSSSAQLSTML